MKKYYENPDVVEHYSSERFSGKRASTHLKESRIIDHLLAGTGKIDSILDIPCGAGRFQKQLWSYADSLTEMDYSSTMLTKAQENMKISSCEEMLAKTKFIEGSIFEIPFPENTFDLVFSMRIYHHFSKSEDRIKILSELKRVGRKWVVLSFYNFRSFQHLRRFIKSKITGRSSKHYAITIARFKKEIEQAGLQLYSYRSNLRFISEQTIVLLEILD